MFFDDKQMRRTIKKPITIFEPFIAIKTDRMFFYSYQKKEQKT